ncbi:hypothetical protein L1049_005863 [Liquidambar formosana]|uniref:S-protein homolog n=1 Tax=Liquidambar formosana TaxID=63359 RepID=A0AAP0RGL6_LIQFO
MDPLKRTSGGLVLLVVTVMFFMKQPSQVFGFPILQKVDVIIVNELGFPKAPLTLHCRSKDDDLGVHVLHYQQTFRWTFRNHLWEDTVFWCDFQWNSEPRVRYHASVTIYGMHVSHRCSRYCNWKIRRVGLFLVDDYAYGQLVPMYIWPVPHRS